MNKIPKIAVTRDGAGWRATCGRPRCGFSFFHVRRDVVDEQAVQHQTDDMKKVAR